MGYANEWGGCATFQNSQMRADFGIRMERKLKIHRPPAYLHFAVADRVTDGWKLQLASARRYHSEHLLNLAPLPQPFRFAMKMECMKAMFAATSQKYGIGHARRHGCPVQQLFGQPHGHLS